MKSTQGNSPFSKANSPEQPTQKKFSDIQNDQQQPLNRSSSYENEYISEKQEYSINSDKYTQEENSYLHSELEVPKENLVISEQNLTPQITDNNIDLTNIDLPQDNAPLISREHIISPLPETNLESLSLVEDDATIADPQKTFDLSEIAYLTNEVFIPSLIDTKNKDPQEELVLEFLENIQNTPTIEETGHVETGHVEADHVPVINLSSSELSTQTPTSFKTIEAEPPQLQATDSSYLEPREGILNPQLIDNSEEKTTSPIEQKNFVNLLEKKSSEIYSNSPVTLFEDNAAIAELKKLPDSELEIESEILLNSNDSDSSLTKAVKSFSSEITKATSNTGLEKASFKDGNINTLESNDRYFDTNNGIKFKIDNIINKGENRLTVKLHPAEFGTVDFKIDIQNNGNAKLTITAENKEALFALKENIQELEMQLKNLGIHTGDSPEFNLKDGDKNHEQKQNNHLERNHTSGEDNPIQEVSSQNFINKYIAANMLNIYDIINESGSIDFTV